MSAGSSVTQHRRRDEEAHTHTKPPPILLPRFRDWFLSVVFFLSPFKLFFFLSLSPSSSLPLSLGGVKVFDSVVPASSQQLRFLDSLSLSFISPRLRSHGNSTWALASATQAETYSVICANFRLYTQVSPIKTLLQCKIRARYWFIRVTINVARHQRRRVKR